MMLEYSKSISVIAMVLLLGIVTPNNLVSSIPLFKTANYESMQYINAVIVNNSIEIKQKEIVNKLNIINNGFDNVILDTNNDYIDTNYFYDGKLIFQYNISSLQYEFVMNLYEDQKIAEFIYTNLRYYFTNGKTILIYCNNLKCKKENLFCNATQINKKTEL